MSFTKPKRPKYKAMPKAPKMTASMETWNRYEAKRKEITKENLKKKGEYEKTLKAYESEMKRRLAIKSKATRF